MDDTELEQIKKRYARRAAVVDDRYSRLKHDVLWASQSRQRALVRLLSAAEIKSLSALDIIEVGCGSGNNLLELVEFGADPGRLTGNDLLEERLVMARRRLPTECKLYAGDASRLEIPTSSLDIVYQSTVFSSILDNALQERLASEMWRWLRPGGAVLWYDLAYDNPSNSDVRGMPLVRIRSLFPKANLRYERVTLAPPIGRRVIGVGRTVYSILECIPMLRSHLLCWIRKD